MQNTIEKFRQSSIVFEKLGIFSENLKTLTSFNYPTAFCGNFAHVFYLPLSTKVWFLHTRFYTLVFYTFINNSRSKQHRKNPTHTFVDITK